jgi:hypothetical protein
MTSTRSGAKASKSKPTLERTATRSGSSRGKKKTTTKGAKEGLSPAEQKLFKELEAKRKASVAVAVELHKKCE